jgi:quinone-modifying oxidoreductase subunit QmoC
MVVQFNSFLPVVWVDYMALAAAILVSIGLLVKFAKWFEIVPKRLFADARRYMGNGVIASSFFSVLARQVIRQKDIINDSRTRWVTHFLVFWGFIGLALATIWDDIFFRNGTLPPPFSIANPGNIIGNIAGAMVLVGSTIMIYRYLFVSKFSKTPKGDMIFFVSLYLSVVSGFATEFLRSLDFNIPTLAVYVLHLAIAGVLLVSAPFTHFFHAVQVPFLRLVDRVQTLLVGNSTASVLNNVEPFRLDYRRVLMSELATKINSQQAAATSPSWLEGKKEAMKLPGDSTEKQKTLD